MKRNNIVGTVNQDTSRFKTSIKFIKVYRDICKRNAKRQCDFQFRTVTK